LIFLGKGFVVRRLQIAGGYVRASLHVERGKPRLAQKSAAQSLPSPLNGYRSDEAENAKWCHHTRRAERDRRGGSLEDELCPDESEGGKVNDASAAVFASCERVKRLTSGVWAEIVSLTKGCRS
jgi:hypothetical protein